MQRCFVCLCADSGNILYSQIHPWGQWLYICNVLKTLIWRNIFRFVAGSAKRDGTEHEIWGQQVAIISWPGNYKPVRRAKDKFWDRHLNSDTTSNAPKKDEFPPFRHWHAVAGGFLQVCVHLSTTHPIWLAPQLSGSSCAHHFNERNKTVSGRVHLYWLIWLQVCLLSLHTD